MNNSYQTIIKQLGKDRVKLNEPMSGQTTFRIGGPADLFFEAETEKELVKAMGVIRKTKVPYFILGGGSNLLVEDRGFKGIVIKVQSKKFKVENLDGKYLVTAEAGLPISVLLSELVKNSIAGLEFMAGIPGTVGGAIRGNAGAWQQNFGDKVVRVKVLTPEDEILWRDNAYCQFDYRHSVFKKNGEIILEVELELLLGQKNEIKEHMRETLEKRSAFPKDPSAGSIFVNPKPLKTRELVEQCGLGGVKSGGAQIAENYTNFIINTGIAKSGDVVTLISLIKEKVKEKFGIDLKEEIVRVGEF